MKIGDYFLLPDIKRLSEEQYNALLVYLKFIGIGCEISYQDIRKCSSSSTKVLMAYKCWDGMLLLFAPEYSVLNNHYSYDDILRMVPLGSLV